jgi:nucleoside-diphosphate-sugar epimerase
VTRPDPFRVLIAGCGYVGTQLGLELAARGDRAFGLRRDPSGLPPQIEPVPADLLGAELADRIPRVDAVVYAAAAGGGGEEGYRRTYVEGVDRILRVLEARDPEARPHRFIFVSSTAVYGDAEGEWVDEDTPPAPEGYRGTTVLEGEARTLASEVPGVVLRLGGIYGPGRTRLPDQVRRGEARLAPDGPLWSNRIHRDDAAGALLHLLDLEAPEAVYLGVDAEPAPLEEVYRWLARRLDAPEPTVDPGRPRDRSNKRCSSQRLRKSGYRFRFPTFRAGYADMLGLPPE